MLGQSGVMSLAEIYLSLKPNQYNNTIRYVLSVTFFLNLTKMLVLYVYVAKCKALCQLYHILNKNHCYRQSRIYDVNESPPCLTTFY